MKRGTRDLWAGQNRHEGDRERLFTAVRGAVDGDTLLYPGSFVDIAPSLCFRAVTYVDIDKRTPGFFADQDGIAEILAESGGSPDVEIRFLHADYREQLELPVQSFDVLASLYAGFVSESCTDYLKIGGTLLAAPSHGDVAMASIDPRYRLTGVVVSRSGDYRIQTQDLETYLVPKSPIDITPEMLHDRGRGIPYTRSPFAYLFRRVT